MKLIYSVWLSFHPNLACCLRFDRLSMAHCAPRVRGSPDLVGTFPLRRAIHTDFGECHERVGQMDEKAPQMLTSTTVFFKS
jgi:hypothetical protein